MILLIDIAVFGLIGSSIFLLLSPKGEVQDETMQRRLKSIVAKKEESIGKVHLLGTEVRTFWERVAAFFLGDNALAAKYTAVRRILHQAGYVGERAVRIFWGLRFFLTGIFAVGALFVAFLVQAFGPHMFLLIALGATLGYLLPTFIVRHKAKRRRLEIQETLPDTLDLLVVCVEAGLGIDAALVRVANDQAEQGLALGIEMQLMTREIQAGIVRRVALSRLADRLEVDELRSLVTYINQTDELGGSIARTLRICATTMRQKRSQKAEEAARKAVIKLIFPVVLFILPALFLVTLAPSIINMVRILSETGLK